MNNRQKANAIVAVLIAVLAGIAIWLVAGTRQPTEVALSSPLKPLTTWTNDLVLTNDELPTSWKYDSDSAYDMPGVRSRFFNFYNTVAGRGAPAVTFSEEFGLFSTPLEASQFYTRWVETLILPRSANLWQTVPELGIPHHAEQMKIACSSDPVHGVPARSCVAVARYQNVILDVFGVVYEDRWLKIPDFRLVLEAADRRIADVLSQQK